jgi:teichuronic acid biosynthesis glycosyltransferase TuaG
MSSEQVKFSIIIPAYNAGKTIVRALQSCLQQTYPVHEIIIVDDASTDDTEALLSAYKEQVKYIQLLKNLGSAAARNKGLDAATGNYIAFLDADDIWHERKLEIIASIFDAKNDISFLYHSYTLQSIDTITIPEGTVLYRTPFIKLLQSNPVATPCAIISNNKQFRFNDSMRYMEDYDLWLRIAYKHKAYYIDIPLTQIGRPVLSEGGVSANKWKMRKGELKTFTRLVKLNPVFLLSLPFLYSYSISKHLYKVVTGK